MIRHCVGPFAPFFHSMTACRHARFQSLRGAPVICGQHFTRAVHAPSSVLLLEVWSGLLGSVAVILGAGIIWLTGWA